MSYYNLTSGRSKIYKTYDDITYGEVAARFNAIKCDVNDYETCIDIANIITHLVNNNSVDDCKTGVSDEAIDILGDFIKKCDPNILKKGTPLEIASNIIKLISENDDEQLSKEDIEQMIERSVVSNEEPIKDENNEEGKEESTESDDNQNESESQESNEESNTSEGSGESDEEENQESESNDSGSEESDEKADKLSPILKKIQSQTKEQVKEIDKFIKVRETGESYGMRTGDVMVYKELSDRHMDFLNKLAIIESRGKLKAKKVLPKEDLNMMTEYDQISKLRNKTELILPSFDYKFVTKSLMVKAPSKPTKQALCLLIDDSGSMSYNWKKDWVQALLWNRATQAEKQHMDLYVAMFIEDVDLTKLVKIKNLEEAKAYYKKCRFNGGMTDVQHCAEKVMAHFTKQNINAQVVIINDGEDHVESSWNPSHELHAITLGLTNKTLKQVIEKKGGHYETF